MDMKQFHVLTPFAVKAVTCPPHDPNTTSTGEAEVIKISGVANFSGDIEAGDIFVDLVGDVVVPSGIDVSLWKKNPQILLHHDRHCTIGRGLSVVKKKDGLYIEAEIHSGALEEEDFYRIKSGLLSYLSVGFRTLSAEYKQVDGKSVYFITKSLLLEVSVVGIPANNESAFQIIKSLPGDDGFYAGALVDHTDKDAPQGDDMEFSVEQIKALAAAIVDEQEARAAAAASEKAEQEAKEKALQEEIDRRLAEAQAAEKAEQEAAAAAAEAEKAEQEAKEKAAQADEIKALIEQITTLKTAALEVE